MRNFTSRTLNSSAGLRACISALSLALLVGVGSAAEPAPSNGIATILSESSQALSVELAFDELQRETVNTGDGTYTSFKLPGERGIGVDGMPDLPAFSRYILIPPGKRAVAEVKSAAPRSLRATHPPQPYAAEPGESAPNRDYYASGGLFPAEPVQVSEPMQFRGNRLALLTACPVQYDASQQSYIQRDRMELELRFEDDPDAELPRHNFRRLPSPDEQRILRSLTLNPPPRRDEFELLSERGYDEYYLFVMQQGYYGNNQQNRADVEMLVGRLIEWKRRSGNKVDLLLIGGNGANGRNPTATDNAIQEYYDDLLEDGIEPFDHILLIGEEETTPYSGNRGQQGFDIFLQGYTAPTSTNPWVDHYDVKWAWLEGDDQIPDVGITRFQTGNLAMLACATNKTLSYESEPYIENDAWFTRAVVEEQAISGANEFMTATVDYYVEALEKHEFEVVAQWRRAQNGGGDPGPWLAQQVNTGIGFIAGRAKNYEINYVWGHSPQGMFQRVGRFPVAILNSGHGEWSAETLIWVGREEYTNRERYNDVQWAKGAVASTCTWSRPPTDPNNVIGGSMVHAVLDMRLAWGWARLWTLMNFKRTFPGDNNSYTYFSDDFSVNGDPGLRYWQGVPRRIRVNHPERIAPGANYIPVRVTDTDNHAIPNILVTLYKGTTDEIELFDLKLTDADGNAIFTIDPELRESVMVTAVARDVYPYKGEVEIGAVNRFVQARLLEIDDDDGGNGDGVIQAGETVLVSFEAANLGNQGSAADVTGVVSALEPWAVVEENYFEFGDIAAGETSEEIGNIEVSISPNAPDDRPVTLWAALEGDNGEWNSAIELHPRNVNLEVSPDEGTVIVPGGVSNLALSLVNRGRLDAPPFRARMLSDSWELSVPAATANYPAINRNQSADPQGNGWTIAGNLLSIPGVQVPVTILIEVNNVVVDSIRYRIQVRQPDEGTPQGPDDYGYVCFDDADSDYDQAPRYRWVEVSMNVNDRDFNGTQVNLNQTRNSKRYGVADLPFEFRYYGQDFDRVTISQTGYLSMGVDENFLPGWWPYSLDGGGVGAGYGMLAPFWGDLTLGQGAGVWMAYDREQGICIIEWYEFRLGGTVVNFEILLYDPAVWVNATGDGNIVFQYRQVPNNMGIASVGITSPDGSTGMGYGYKNNYPVTSAPLQNRRALLFTTSPRFITGVIHGYVRDAANDHGIEGASVVTSYGQLALTDADGYYIIADALAQRFNLIAHMQGYNDSTRTGFELAENDTLVIDFDLLHPEFTPSLRLIDTALDSGDTAIFEFTVENTGNGPMEWEVTRHLPRGADVDPWVQRPGYAITDIVNEQFQIDDHRIEGVAFARDRFYITGGDHDPRFIYVMDRDGVLLDTIPQPGGGRFGIFDLAWDGELLWGSGEHFIYGFTTDGQVVDTIESGINTVQALAWDSDRNILWSAAITSNYITGYSRDGQFADEHSRKGLYMYGLAYYPQDPDGYPLYIFNSPTQDQFVHKMNTESGDTMFVRQLFPEGGGSPRGNFITNQFDVYSWVMMGIANSPAGDRIDIWQLDSRRDWFRLDLDYRERWIPAEGGILNAGIENLYRIFVDSRNLAPVLWEGYFFFHHNAADGMDSVWVSIEVLGEPEPPRAFDLLEPADGDTLDISREIAFVWQESTVRDLEQHIVYSIWFRVGEDSLQLETTDTTLALNPADLDLNFVDHSALTWWVQAAAGELETPSDSRFTLNYLFNSGASNPEIPVEFGLKSIHPNPFNAQTTVRFGLESPAATRLIVYDLAGRQVASLVDGRLERGWHQVSFRGDLLPSGLYIVRLESGEGISTRKIALVR